MYIGRLKVEIKDVVNEILDQIPHDIIVNGTILDNAIGGGQFVVEVERRKRAAGKTDAEINSTVFGYESNSLSIGFAKNKNNLVGTYEVCTDLTRNHSMKFDVIVGNPPFNIASSSGNTIAGTSGNVVFYRKFIDKAFCDVKKDGYIAMVVPRAGIRYANEKYGISSFSFDTSSSWEIAAGYFIRGGMKKGNISNNTILRKCCSLENSFTYRNAIGGSYDALLESKKIALKKGDVYGIIDLPNGIKSDVTMGFINTNPIIGPKVMFKGLESSNSYISTDLPSYVGSSCSIIFETKLHADAALLFIKNSKLLKYIKRMTSEKTLGATFRLFKDFDLMQIKTGSEYPKEFGLTKKEIEYVEANA